MTLTKLLTDRRGATATEYGLIAALIAVSLVAVLRGTGQTSAEQLDSLNHPGFANPAGAPGSAPVAQPAAQPAAAPLAQPASLPEVQPAAMPMGGVGGGGDQQSKSVAAAAQPEGGAAPAN